jgi:hypothetical protein
MSDQQPKTKSKRLPGICVRVTEDELERLKKMSETSGMSMPDILRKNTLSRKDLEAPLLTRADANEILVALARIGNNLNQISKRINSGIMEGWSQSFNALYREWKQMTTIFSVNRGIR